MVAAYGRSRRQAHNCLPMDLRKTVLAVSQDDGKMERGALHLTDLASSIDFDGPLVCLEPTFRLLGVGFVPVIKHLAPFFCGCIRVCAGG